MNVSDTTLYLFEEADSFWLDKSRVYLIDELACDAEKGAVDGFSLYLTEVVLKEDEIKLEDISESLRILFWIVKLE